MKLWVALIPLALAPLIWAGVQQLGQKPSSRPAPAFELKATTTNRQGTPQTEYVYSIRGTDGKVQEKWLLTLDEEHLGHWISPSGSVWVLTSSAGGPARIWERDASGDAKGGASVADVLGRSEQDVDLDKTQAVSLQGGAQQLRLAMKNGDETRFTLVFGPDGTATPIVRTLAQPFQGQDLLTQALEGSTNYNGPAATWPMGEDETVAVWKVGTANGWKFVAQVYRSTERPLQVVSERSVDAMPAEVQRTPSGRILWFEFDEFGQQPRAQLDVLSQEGALEGTVDLMKLGRFANSKEARAALRLRDVQFMTELGTDRIRLSDSTGRQYSIVTGKTLTAEASLNIDQVPAKEPTELAGTPLAQTARSDDGKFELRVKKAGDVLQLTLVANVDDPVQGRKQAQLWSMPCPAGVLAFRVSNSGRVYGLVKLVNEQAPAGRPKEILLFNTWDTIGKQAGGLDVVSLKWFASVDEAVKGIDLNKLKIELGGTPEPKEIGGVPVQAWPIEQLTFTFNDGRTESIYLKRMNDYMPTTFMRGVAKK